MTRGGIQLLTALNLRGLATVEGQLKSESKLSQDRLL